MKKTILITNIPSHYRQAIFENLSAIGVDFAFSDESTSISPLDYTKLKSKVNFFRFFQLGGGIGLVPRAILESLKYQNIIMTGDFRGLHVWCILFIASITGKRVYLWGHSWYGRERRLKKLVKYLFFKPAHKILTYGEYAKNLMVKEGYSSSKIVPIHNSLSYEEQLKERLELMTRGSSFEFNKLSSRYVVYVGRLNRNKKLTLVLDALKRVAEITGLNISFWVIGPEHDNGELRNYSHYLGMQQFVKFVGPVYEESLLSKYLYHAAACVSPGNVGLTAIHSLTFGTPVITHNNFKNQMPEFEAVIPGKTGLFFEENSVDSLADAIYKIVNLTDTERAEIRQACFDEVDRVWNTRYQMEIFRKILE